MATLNDAVAAISSRIGFAAARTRTVARRLQEVGILASGAPGVAPEVDLAGFVSLVIALAADTELHRAAEAVTAYRALGLPGHDATRMPASVKEQYQAAGDALDVLAELAASGPPDAQRDVSQVLIEVVSNWPEVAIHEAGSVRRFQEAGALAGRWAAAGHRKSTTINGSAFVDAIRDLRLGE